MIGDPVGRKFAGRVDLPELGERIGVGGVEKLVPVRVNAVPRDEMMEAMRQLRGIAVKAPVDGGSAVATVMLKGEEYGAFATASVPARD